MGGSGEVADGLDGRDTPTEVRGQTPTPSQVAAAAAANSSSSSSTNNSLSPLVVPIPVLGLTGTTTKLRLFVEMFESVVGTDTYSKELEEVLVKKKLISQHMLMQVKTMEKVGTACTAAWISRFDADEADTACDAIEVTRSMFKDAHGIGGRYYVVDPLLGLGGGPPLVPGAMFSSISGGAGGTGIGTGAPGGFVVPSGLPSPPPGEKFRNTSSLTRDKDGLLYNCNKPADAPLFVINHQHLFRALTAERIPLVLGPDADLTPQGYYDLLESVSTLITGNREFDPAFSTVVLRRDIRQIRVMTDMVKFERILMFQWVARKPYLLNLNDFLPETARLRVEDISPNVDDLHLIEWALRNLARVFSVLLGEPLNDYFKSLKPVIDMLGLVQMQTVPTSWICYQISMGLEIVMTKMRKGIPPPSEPDKYRKVGAFRGLLEAEMVVVVNCMPSGDNMSVSMDTFISVTHKDIEYVKPGTGGKGGNSDQTKSVEKRTAPTDGSEQTSKSKTQRRNERKRLNKGDKDGGGQGAGGPSLAKYGPSTALCPAHMLELLQVKGRSGYVIYCESRGWG